jgi:hypothetical protein
MNIVIVGGGTAGWLAALMISKTHGDSHAITVIESSKIGIVGAGEGSTGLLTDIIQGHGWNYGCNEEDFFRETGATVKLGIRHRDWKQRGHSYIAPIDGTRSGSPDYMLMHAISNDIPFHTSSMNGYFIEKSLSSFFKTDGKIENHSSHAYHFDAFKVGKYFKKICGETIRNVDAVVVDIDLAEDGTVDAVVLDCGETISGDFFIDCSGFKRIFAEKMGNRWISYKKHLPVNAAMPFFKKYGEEQIDPVTTAWAQSSGWMWQIPTQERYGCGYVFCDDFISDEQARREVEASLGTAVEPIRFLKFDTGRLDSMWKKNCLSLGLAAAFAEPLEATSIHSTIVQIQAFVFEYLREDRDETCNSGMMNVYNRRMGKMYDDFRDFLVLHYMTQRDDSQFWRFLKTGETMTSTVRDVLELVKTRPLYAADVDAYHGHAGSSLFNWILAGLGYITKDLAQKDLAFHQNHNVANDVWALHEHNMQISTKNMISNNDLIRFHREQNGYHLP